MWPYWDLTCHILKFEPGSVWGPILTCQRLGAQACASLGAVKPSYPYWAWLRGEGGCLHVCNRSLLCHKTVWVLVAGGHGRTLCGSCARPSQRSDCTVLLCMPRTTVCVRRPWDIYHSWSDTALWLLWLQKTWSKNRTYR